MRPAFGDWRSLIGAILYHRSLLNELLFQWDEGVGGSNPLSPTKFEKNCLLNEQAFLHLSLGQGQFQGLMKNNHYSEI